MTAEADGAGIVLETLAVTAALHYKTTAARRLPPLLGVTVDLERGQLEGIGSLPSPQLHGSTVFHRCNGIPEVQWATATSAPGT